MGGESRAVLCPVILGGFPAQPAGLTFDFVFSLQDVVCVSVVVEATADSEGRMKVRALLGRVWKQAEGPARGW